MLAQLKTNFYNFLIELGFNATDNAVYEEKFPWLMVRTNNYTVAHAMDTKISTATLVASNGSSNLALATAIRVKSLAFSVAASGSDMCTQESCSLKFANSNKNLFKPASSTHLRKVGS